ncbi:MAG: DinB family protein [Thermonemataceae bacterium]
MNLIIRSSQHILKQIHHLVVQLTPQQYTHPLEILSNNSLSKHIRHVLEFYVCLFEGVEKGVINYDKRSRDIRLETSQSYTEDLITKQMQLLEATEQDQNLTLEVLLSDIGETTTVPTTLHRELVYNIEHAIHHMAIVKIAVHECYQEVTLPKDFGIAYSTIKYHQSQAT